MDFRILDSVAVTHDLPAHCLKRGDLGAVVHVYPPNAIEVEFVTASGHLQAIVTLTTRQVRPVGPKDLLAVRRLDAT
jgi:hypothetical protein